MTLRSKQTSRSFGPRFKLLYYCLSSSSSHRRVGSSTNNQHFFPFVTPTQYIVGMSLVEWKHCLAQRDIRSVEGKQTCKQQARWTTCSFGRPTLVRVQEARELLSDCFDLESIFRIIFDQIQKHEKRTSRPMFLLSIISNANKR